jgi:ABC-2 type transport system ATP-binding protein
MANGLVAAGLAGTVKLPPHLLAALAPLLVVVLALDVYCLVDVARARSVRNAPKIAWVIVILAFSAPLGALLYLFFGKDRGKSGGAPSAAPPPGPSAESAEPVPASVTDAAAEPPAPASGEPIVTTSGLTRDYGGTGLFDVDLVVPRGSIYGLVGPNGAGKTTLLSIVCGVRRSDSGAVCLDVARDKIAVCPDVPEFDGWLTAYEVVDLARALVAGSARPGPDDPSSAILSALRTAGIADAVDRRVAGFSRGMVQRLGLACALVTDPELLILDEPTSALDPAGRAEMLNLVAAMRGTKTVIFSSHILADVQRVADQVGIMRDGRLLYQGSASDLIEQHLRPSWLVKIAGDAPRVAEALREQPWATRVEPAGGGLIRVDADSIESGERGIPAVIAACGARQVSCEPVAADLESAFLALTSEPMAEAR